MMETIAKTECKVEDDFIKSAYEPINYADIQIHGDPFPIKLENLSTDSDSEITPVILNLSANRLVKIEVFDDDIDTDYAAISGGTPPKCPKIENSNSGNNVLGTHCDNELRKNVKCEPELIINTDANNDHDADEQLKRTNKRDRKKEIESSPTGKMLRCNECNEHGPITKTVSLRHPCKKPVAKIILTKTIFKCIKGPKKEPVHKQPVLSDDQKPVQNIVFNCEWCSDQYPTMASLQSHTLLIHSKPYACKICPKSFSNYYFYQIHTTIHNDLKKPLCNVCMRKFSTIDRLQQHMLIHLREKPHVCHICSKGYLQSSDLTYHLEKCRDQTKQMFNCKICFESCSSPTFLMAHLATHCNDKTPKPYYCSLCLTPFWYSSYFIRHMIVHSGIRPYICDICKKNFDTRKALKRHMSIHIEQIQPN